MPLKRIRNGRNETNKGTAYQQIGITNALIDFVDKTRPAREGKALVKRVQLHCIHIGRLEKKGCKEGQENRTFVRANFWSCIVDIEVIVGLAIGAL